MPKMSAIEEIADARTKEEFADALAGYTALSAVEVRMLFPTKADQKELLELLKIGGDSTLLY